jgi:predicted metal-binding membrane protein
MSVFVAPRPRELRMGIAAALLAVTAAAWVLLDRRMAGMSAGPGGDPGAAGWFVVTWATMTAAMMLPAVAPALPGVARGRRISAAPALVLFLLGYGAVWMTGGLLGYAILQVVRGLHGGVLDWSQAGRYLAGAGVLAAALYQLTGTKRRWLQRCAAPRLPLPSDPASASLRAGIRHGRNCVGCCWTLMAALYALGMMSLAWMALITAMIALERLLPRPQLGARAIAAVLAVLGLAILAVPAEVPLLDGPHTGAAMRTAAMPTPSH